MPASLQRAINVEMRDALSTCDGGDVCKEISTHLRLAKRLQFTAPLNAVIVMIACVIGGSTGTLSLKSLSLKTLKAPTFALIAVAFDIAARRGLGKLTWYRVPITSALMASRFFLLHSTFANSRAWRLAMWAFLPALSLARQREMHKVDLSRSHRLIITLGSHATAIMFSPRDAAAGLLVQQRDRARGSGDGAAQDAADAAGAQGGWLAQAACGAALSSQEHASGAVE